MYFNTLYTTKNQGNPNVTGVLPILLEKATRIAQALLLAGKEYIALMYLHKKIEEEKIRKNLEEFTGRIQQKPPIKSAVRRIERTREVYYINILEVDEQYVLFKIGCQAGTYIRKYCHDFGKKIGCGAHMVELRRTKVAGFDESTLFTLHDLTDAFYYCQNKGNDVLFKKIVQPIENAIEHLPKVWVLDSTIKSLSHGRDLAIPGISKIHSKIQKDELVAIMTLKNELIAFGNANLSSEEVIAKDRGIALKTKNVFI